MRPLITTVLVMTLAPSAPLDAAGPIDASHWLSNHSWRCIGPSRGGRVASVAGVRGDPLTYYMGACGGGVWKTTNAGATWRPVSDGYFGTGAVGAVAVAESDPNVVYAGTGESCVRGNFSHGDGIYKSEDAGKTWAHIGLRDSRQVGRIIVHPRDADVVFVAALGHVFGPNAERGVYRSRDGGASWENVLSVNDRTGAVDVRFDPLNPRVLYAGMWQISRSPWGMESGGPGSGLYRSRDGGDTWEELTNGLPAGIKGKIAIAPSPAQRDRVWAIVEAEDGGVFRSDDGGDTWRRTNDDRDLRQRAWYYTHIYADTQDPETVYVLNVRFHKSIDGGRTFDRTIRVPHGDNHDLWIDPDDNQRMVQANDGGANVSFDGGATWSRQDNQPTAQFYHVITDTNFPYRVYGAQQDNSTACVSSLNRVPARRDDFYPVGGGESGYIAPRPDDPNIVFAGSYGGYLTRYDHRLRKSRNITVWPENPMGAGVEDLAHRFQWTFPIVISPHDPDVLYVAGESLFKSTDEGTSFEKISPDLTTNDKTKQRSSGGPITKDNTGVEYYCTIFAVAESPVEAGVIWTGSDDGRVHVTGDGGETWTDVTPSDMGDWPMISLIDASPHDADTAYLAVNRYKMDDFRPSVYRTRDRGETWARLSDGIDDGAFVRAVREDPERAGLLYAGTETGVYCSFDAGDAWQPLQLNLPVVPITDLVVHGDDLVVATQGRSFWVLSGLNVLRQIDGGHAADEVTLFAPAVTYRQNWDSVQVHANLPDGADGAFEVLDDDGTVLRAWHFGDGPDGEDADEDSDDDTDEDADESQVEPDRASVTAGMNVFRWNMRLPDPVYVPGAVSWPSHPPGPRVVPGTYVARLRVAGDTHEVPLEIHGDPRVPTTDREYAAQFALLMDVHEALSDANGAVNTIRSIKSQVAAAAARAKKAGAGDAVGEAATKLRSDLSAIEEVIIQTKSKSSQDPLNFPIRLNDKIGAIARGVDGDYGPTEQSRSVLVYLREQLDEQLAALDAIVTERVPAFNELVRTEQVPAIVVDEATGDVR